jgi:hypothetical protein
MKKEPNQSLQPTRLITLSFRKASRTSNLNSRVADLKRWAKK